MRTGVSCSILDCHVSAFEMRHWLDQNQCTLLVDISATRFCIAHGGGRRCTYLGCDKGARDKFFCAAWVFLCLSIAIIQYFLWLRLNLSFSQQPRRRETLQTGWMPQVGRWRVTLLHWARWWEAMQCSGLWQVCAIIHKILRQTWRGKKVLVRGLQESCSWANFVLCRGK